MNTDISNTPKDIQNVHQQYPVHEIGDRKLCEIINITYNEFKKLTITEQIKLSEKYLQETIDLILKDEFQYIENDKYGLLNNYSVNINEKHIKHCDCCDLIKLRLLDISAKKNANKITTTNYTLDPKNNESERFAVILKNNKSNLDELVVYYLQNSTFLRNPICPYIRKELYKTIKLFEKDYDLSKAKVRMIVGGILSYQTSLIESSQHFRNNGMFEVIQDRFGNVVNTISQNEHYKVKLNEKIIEAVKILDQMIEGNKNVNININQNSLSIEDVLAKFKSEK